MLFLFWQRLNRIKFQQLLFLVRNGLILNEFHVNRLKTGWLLF